MDYVAIYRYGRLMNVLHKAQLRTWLVDNLFLTSEEWSGKNWSDEALIARWRGYGVTFRPCKSERVPILEKMFNVKK